MQAKDNTRRVAIACQGGGIHGAFTCGVLTKILQAKEDEENGTLPEGAQRRFEICGLSGTSAGALNAFMVWYGLMLNYGEKGRFAEARRAVNNLWETFQVRKSGEAAMNQFAQLLFGLQQFGASIKSPTPARSYDLLMSMLGGWSTVENLVLPKMDFGEIRPEFYSFEALLKSCAPQFSEIAARLTQIGRKKQEPRLLIGAVEIRSGEFEAFDSFDIRKPDEARRTISYEAVQASGTLPEIRRSQRIPGLKNSEGQEVLYWDGLFSQNPPIREFVAGVDPNRLPHEIWVIRINPQKRDSEPEKLDDIEDRRNELAGNLSLNQELRFIKKVNEWIARYPEDFGKEKQPIDVYMITISKQWSDKLYPASKFDRKPAFVNGLRKHGEARGEDFLELWFKTPDLSRFEWPANALDVRAETLAEHTAA